MAERSATTPRGSQRLQTALYYARKKRRARYMAGLPTADPGAQGVAWNDNGIIKISAG